MSHIVDAQISCLDELFFGICHIGKFLVWFSGAIRLDHSQMSLNKNLDDSCSVWMLL